MGLDALAKHISERSGTGGIDKINDFQEWYGNEGFGDLGSLKPLRMLLVGLGADDRTERMVRFLVENSGMDISLLTFHGFDYDGKTILAKQVEVDAADEADRRPTRRRRTQAELDRDFNEQIANYGVRDLVDAVRACSKRIGLNLRSAQDDMDSRSNFRKHIVRNMHALMLGEKEQ